MCLFSKRLNGAIVRARLSKRRGEQRHGGGEDDSEKRKGRRKEKEVEEEEENAVLSIGAQAARLVSRMSRA